MLAKDQNQAPHTTRSHTFPKDTTPLPENQKDNPYRPKVVDQQIEDAQDDHQHDGAPLGLEAHHDHDASHEADNADQDAPEAPLARKDEADEQEDQKHPTRQLKVHLAVLLVNLRQPGRSEPFADPAVREHHQETTHDREIAQEEVQIEDESVAERLGDDDADETPDGVFTILPGDDEHGRDDHSDNVD